MPINWTWCDGQYLKQELQSENDRTTMTLLTVCGAMGPKADGKVTHKHNKGAITTEQKQITTERQFHSLPHIRLMSAGARSRKMVMHQPEDNRIYCHRDLPKKI